MNDFAARLLGEIGSFKKFRIRTEAGERCTQLVTRILNKLLLLGEASSES